MRLAFLIPPFQVHFLSFPCPLLPPPPLRSVLPMPHFSGSCVQRQRRFTCCSGIQSPARKAELNSMTAISSGGKEAKATRSNPGALALSRLPSPTGELPVPATAGDCRLRRGRSRARVRRGKQWRVRWAGGGLGGGGWRLQEPRCARLGDGQPAECRGCHAAFVCSELRGG